MAGMKDQFPFLPGHLVEFTDGGLRIKNDPNPPSTESILILGTAVDGPVNVPVAVDPSTAEVIFGKAASAGGVANGATLTLGFEEAWNAGCRDIRLMRISGDNATAVLTAAPQALDDLYKTVEQDLGVVIGNEETSFILSHQNVDAASIKLFANGVELAATAFTHAEATGTTTVTLLQNQTDTLAQISISYSYTEDGQTLAVSESGTTAVDGTFQPWRAAGLSQTLHLDQIPVSVVVTADGVPVAVTGSGQDLTLAPGVAPKGAELVASYSYKDTTPVVPRVGIESVFAGTVYNQVKVRVEAAGAGKKVVFVKPSAKKSTLSEKALEYTSSDYKTLEDLVEAVNADPRNNIVRLTVSTEFAPVKTETLTLSAEQPLAGGTDGVKLTKEQLFQKLSGERDATGLLVKSGAYQLLENYAVDYVVPMGVFVDDKLVGGKSFAYELALACAVMSHRNHVTHGVIATTSPALPTLAAIDDHINGLTAEGPLNFFMLDANGDEIVDADGNKIALGHFISVLAGPDVRLDSIRLGTYAANSAAVYAAMLSNLPVKSSPMNKRVPGIQGLRYAFGNAQLNKLTSARYVTYETKANGAQIVVTDGITAAAYDSDFAQVTAFRAVKAAADEVRAACDPFLGESNDVANRNAMSSAIGKRLEQMKAAGAVQGFEFRVVSSVADQVLGTANIELTIVPPLTLRKITTVISLAPAL